MKTLREEFQRRGEPLDDLIFPRIERKGWTKPKGDQAPAPTKAKSAMQRMRKRGEKRHVPDVNYFSPSTTISFPHRGSHAEGGVRSEGRRP